MIVTTQMDESGLFIVYGSGNLFGVVLHEASKPSSWVSSCVDTGIRFWNTFDDAVASLTQRYSSSDVEDCRAWLRRCGMESGTIGWLGHNGRFRGGIIWDRASAEYVATIIDRRA